MLVGLCYWCWCKRVNIYKVMFKFLLDKISGLQELHFNIILETHQCLQCRCLPLFYYKCRRGVHITYELVICRLYVKMSALKYTLYINWHLWLHDIVSGTIMRNNTPSSARLLAFVAVPSPSDMLLSSSLSASSTSTLDFTFWTVPLKRMTWPK